MPVLVVQARNGSTRFPRKMSSRLVDRLVIEWVLHRAKMSQLDDFILATSTLPEDDNLENIAKSYGYKVIRGDSRDVLSRYSTAAKNVKDDLIVRITGDCPLIDPELIKMAVMKAMEQGSDYLAFSGIINGFDVEVVKREWILMADQKAKLPSEREHVTPYIIKSKRAKKVFLKLHEEDLSHIHLSLDYPEDLVVIERIIRALGGIDNFSYWDVLKLIKENPKVLKREKEVIPNEGYLKSLQEDREYIRNLKEKPLRLEKSLKHLEEVRRILPNCTQTFGGLGSFPLFANEARGCTLTDVDGNQFVDYHMHAGACLLGYSFEPVVQRVKKELERGTLPGYLEKELAELLVEAIPCAEMVSFGKSAPEAISMAIQLAKAYTRRDVVVFCGYRAPADKSLLRTGLFFSFEYNNIQSIQRLFKEYPNRIACVIVVPAGVEEPEEGFLQEVREITHKEGTLLIFDEASTGFRFSLGGAQEFFRVVPDLACFGESMGNGMPVSAVVGRREIMELSSESSFPVFGSHTASIASAIATIEYIKENMVINQLWEQGRKLKEGLHRLIKDKELEDIASVKGYPVKFLLEFTGEDTLKLRTLFQQECAKRGVLFVGEHNMALPHDDEVIQRTLEVYDQVLDIIKYAVEYSMVDELVEIKYEPAQS